MKVRKDEFDRLGIAVVLVSFAEPERLAVYQERHHWPFPILADPERIAYRAFALNRLSWLQVFSLSTLKLYLRLLREGKRLQNYGKDDYYQSGGDFLVDGERNILFAYRSEDPADRPPLEQLLKIVVDRKA